MTLIQGQVLRRMCRNPVVENLEMSSLPSAEWGPFYEGSTSIGALQEYNTCFLLYFSLYIEIQVLFIRN